MRGIRARSSHLLMNAASMTVLVILQAGITSASFVQSAPEAPTIWSGVFTDLQARRGEKIAATYCAGCHGLDLGGGDSGPKLIGPTFLGNWSEKTVGDLFDWIKTQMPEDAPGSLTPENTANVLAYILEMNKIGAGSKELPVDRTSLDQIRIVAQSPKK